MGRFDRKDTIKAGKFFLSEENLAQLEMTLICVLCPLTSLCMWAQNKMMPNGKPWRAHHKLGPPGR